MTGFPKPEPRARTKGREKRQKAKTTAEVRQYVFARERDICRCCRLRPAESMHEIVSRGRRGKVSKKNSIALCGNGVFGCHGFCQRYEVVVTMSEYGAESLLMFQAVSPRAAEWLHVKINEVIESPPMQQMENAE